MPTGFSRYQDVKETPRLALATPLCHDGDSQCGSTQGQGHKGARGLIAGLGQLIIGSYLLLFGLVAGIVLGLVARLVLGLVAGIVVRPILNLVRVRDDAFVADSSVVSSIAIDVCLGDLVVDIVAHVSVIGVLADAGVRDGIRVVAIVHNSGQHIRSDTISGQREKLGVVLGARAQTFLVRGILPSDRSADVGISGDDGERGRDDADVVKAADVVADYILVGVAIAQVDVTKTPAGFRAVAFASCRNLLRIGRIG